MNIPPVIRSSVNKLANTIKNKTLNVAERIVPDRFVRQNSAEIKETLKRETAAGAGKVVKKISNFVSSNLPDMQTVESYKREAAGGLGKVLKRLNVIKY